MDAREAAVAKIRTVEEAEARKTAVRARLLGLLGGLPDYNGPLNAKITGGLEKLRYTIEKVIFESHPQFYVTANLYLLRDRGKHPGILFPLGHRYCRREDHNARENGNMMIQGVPLHNSRPGQFAAARSFFAANCRIVEDELGALVPVPVTEHDFGFRDEIGWWRAGF